MYKLKKAFIISCSHRLCNDDLSKTDNEEFFGKCYTMHGHNYKIILHLKSEHINDKTGMLVNFDEIKPAFKKHIDDIYDHQTLNDCPGFKDGTVPTAENMARIFYVRLKNALPDLYAIEVYETDTASAIYEDSNK